MSDQTQYMSRDPVYEAEILKALDTLAERFDGYASQGYMGNIIHLSNIPEHRGRSVDEAVTILKEQDVTEIPLDAPRRKELAYMVASIG